MQIWMTFKVRYNSGGSVLDREPTMFYDIMFHENEITALRHANATGGHAILPRPGRTLDDIRLENVPYTTEGG